MKSFDVIVIGSGSGLEVSSAAAQRGLSVAVVEPGPFGGTCLNRGCIPSKMLIHSADVAEAVRRAGLFGIEAQVTSVNWKAIIDRVARMVDADARAVEEGNRDAPNITVFKDSGRFTGRRVLAVGDEEITAETIVLAAGARPTVPNIDGLKDVPFISSDEALRLTEQPRKMVVVGGGYIAAEMAHFFGALGTEVAIVEIAPRMLLQEDDDVGNRFTDIYRRKFNLLLSATVRGARRNGAGIALDIEQDGKRQTLTADTLLVATGRRPNTDLLAVAETGVTIDERGFVKVDQFLETEVPGIWALGDIVGRNQLKHNANLEAAHVAHNIFNPGQKVAVDYHAIPRAVFGSPQVASVGLTERQARQQDLPFVSASYAYIDTGYGSAIEDRDGFVKVLANRETREILGCHILGTDASILVQEAANAMRMRLTIDAVTESIYVHPALPEVVQRAFWSLEI